MILGSLHFPRICGRSSCTRSEKRSEEISLKRHWRSRSFIFSDEDVALFAERLKATLPQVRFVPRDPYKEQDTSPGSTAEPAIPYRDTLTSHSNFAEVYRTVWLEPKGWKPVWSKPVDYGYRFIENLPQSSFTWFPSGMGYGSWFDDKGRMRLALGEVTAHVAEGDRDHAAFVNKAWRIIAQLSTNKTPWSYHDLATGEVRGPFVGNQIWIGHGALKWVRQDPRHCFFHRHRPSDSIDTMPTPSESLPPNT